MFETVAALALVAQTVRRTTTTFDAGAFFAVLAVVFVISLIFYVFYAFCLMKIFEKAGITKWYAWVPYVNNYGLWKMTGREVLWLILLFVPYVNIVALFVIFIDVAKSFGKDSAYGVGLALLGFVFLPMLAFGDSTYLGPVHVPPGGGTAPGQPPYGQQPPPPYGSSGQPPYGQPPYPSS